MKMNNKGFTMVELLVSMAIMGLLVIMAFPTIRAIQTNNTNKKYEEYGKSAISAAKLYVDSYGDDIFDPTKSSQKYQLNFDDLVKKDLIKDINISDSTCITGRSNVWVVKYNDDYSYCLHMSCKIKGTDDSVPPIYETIDRVGSCKDIANKIKNVKYIYNDGTKDNEYLDEVIDGDDNYRIVPISRTGFRFNDNHDVFLKWVNDGKEYDPNVIYDKKATGSTVFKAKTRKWEYYIYFDKNDATYGGSMSSPQKCSYGASCKLTLNGYKKEAYTFKHWKSGSSTDTYTNGEEVREKIGNKIPKDGTQIHLTGIFRKNICSVKYNANGGKLQTAHGSTITQSGNKILVSENEVHHKVEYGDKLGTSGLNDWNNKNYINLLRTGFHIDAGQEWNTKSDGSGTTFNQTTQHAGTTLCPDLKNGDKEVTVYANWKKNSCTITYNANGGTFNAHASDLTHSFTYGSNIGNSSGMRKASSGYYNATRTGYIIPAQAAWTNGSKTFDENTNYKIEQICSMENANGTVTLKVNWKKNDNKDISCAAGKYLKANATTCSQCEAGYYCPGGTWKKKNAIQGRYNCPSGYGNSAAGSIKVQNCYVKVSGGMHVASKRAAPVKCPEKTYKAAHNVYYDSTSNCNSCPTGYLNSPKGSDSATDCYMKVAANKYVKTAKATSATACATGMHKDAHNVYYNSTSKCNVNICTVTYDPGSSKTRTKSLDNGKFNNNNGNRKESVAYGSYFGDTTNGMRNANGGYYDATLEFNHIDASKAWVDSSDSSRTFNENNRYLAQNVCKNLGTGNSSVTLKVNWQKNGIKINYYAPKGLKLAPSKKQACPKAVGKYCYKCEKGDKCELCKNTENEDGCTGSRTGLIKKTVNYVPFDSTVWASDGVKDNSDIKNGKLFMTSDGTRNGTKGTGNWAAYYGGKKIKTFDEDKKFDPAWELAGYLGLLNKLKNGNLDIDLKAVK